MKTLTIFILAGALALLAQPNQLDLRQDPPTAVQSERVSSAYTGATGATTYYYWVVTRYPIGFIVPTAPVIVGGASALGGGNSVALAWPAMTGASSYDVLRTTTNAAPSSCTCAVVLATTGTTLTDNGAALSAWPPGGLNSAGVAQAELQINNRDAGSPYITMAVRNAQRTLNYQLGILKNGTAPSYVPSGFIQPYANAQGALACVDSTGADCMATRPGPTNYCADVGAVNAFACNLSPAITAYAIGNLYWFKAAAANTGPATVNFNGLGNLAIRTPDGADIAAGDIRANQIVGVSYTGAVMQMQSASGNVPILCGGVSDTAAIQAAIDAGANKTLEFSHTNCAITSLAWASNVSARFDDTTFTIVGSPNSGIVMTGLTNVHFSGTLNLVSDSPGETNQVYGLDVTGLTNSSFDVITANGLAFAFFLRELTDVRFGTLSGVNIRGQYQGSGSLAGDLVGITESTRVSIGSVTGTNIWKSAMYFGGGAGADNNTDCYVGSVKITADPASAVANALGVRSVIGLSVDSVQMQGGYRAILIQSEVGDSHTISNIAIGQVIASSISAANGVGVYCGAENSAIRPNKIAIGQIVVTSAATYSVLVRECDGVSIDSIVSDSNASGNAVVFADGVHGAGESIDIGSIIVTNPAGTGIQLTGARNINIQAASVVGAAEGVSIADSVMATVSSVHVDRILGTGAPVNIGSGNVGLSILKQSLTMLDYTNAIESWSPFDSPTVTNNAAAAPDGTMTAASVAFSASANSQVYQNGTAFESGVVYQFSVWLRAAAPTNVRMEHYDGATLVVTSDFPITTTWARYTVNYTGAGGVLSYVGVVNSTAGAAQTIYMWGASLCCSVTP